MCRSTTCGDRADRRCPSHRDPRRKALASAVLRLSRWERRLTAAEDDGDDNGAERALGYVLSAINDINDRSAPQQTSPEIDQSPPAIPEPEPLDDFELRKVGDEDLEALWREHATDPVGQQLIENEWARRDMIARDDVDYAAFQLTSYHTLVNWLHSPQDLSDQALREAWLDGHIDPQLRELAETEMDRRALAHAEDPREDAQLADALDQRLEWAYENMSPNDYRRYERTVVLDPAHRTPASARWRPTIRELRTEYHEWSFERYLAAEDFSRAHLLNARGQALKVDPFTLLSGNAKRAQAYGSEELLSFLASTGGHMSFARFKQLRTTGHDYAKESIEGFSDAIPV